MDVEGWGIRKLSEVSTRALDLLFMTLRRRKIDPAELVAGTRYTVFELEKDFRIPWDDFAEICEHFERLVGGPDELRRVGHQFFESPLLAPVSRVGAFLTHPRQMYITTDRYLGNILFSVVQSHFELKNPSWGVMTLEVPERYRDCRQFFHLTQGTFERMPSVLGYPDAEVSLELSPRRGVYEIYMPPRPGVSVENLRRLWRVVRDPEAVQAEIAHQHAEVRRIAKELRSAEDALRKSEALWRGLAENAPDLIIALNRQGIISFANRGHFASGQELVGRRLADLADADQRGSLETAIGQVLAGGTVQTFDAPWTRVVGTRRHYSSQIGPIMEHDRVTGAVVQLRDVTEQKRADEERRGLEKRLRASERLESLGLLAGGIAHDFNNLLQIVLAQTEHLRGRLLRQSIEQEELDYIEKASGQGVALIRQLLVYAGRSPADPKKTDLSAAVREMSHLLSSMIPSGVQFDVRLEDGLSHVFIDPSQFQQVVMNLVTNAVSALESSDGSTVSLRTYRQEVCEETPLRQVYGTFPVPGSYAVLEVSDDGCGMDAITQERIFEPFFSTRKEGNGLGLATVFGVLSRHDSSIEVESEPGQGALFRVRFPARNELALPETVGKRTAPRGARILLVEDEAILAQATARSLRAAGFRVFIASTAGEALSHFSENAEGIDGAVVDYILPGERDGVDVALALRAMQPRMPIVLSSGLLPTRAELEQRGLVPEGRLSKPYHPRVLIELLHQLLGKAPERHARVD